jgi:DNA-binding IclR family transcriptional regulator
MAESSRAAGIQVVARSAEILRAVNGKPHGLSLSEITATVNLPRSTVHRIVNALGQEGLVVPASPNGRYRLGPEILRLAATERSHMRFNVRPHLEALSKDTTETVDLSVLVRHEVVFIDQVVSTVHPLRAVSAVGQVFPAWCTAPGKALLARMSDEKVRRLLPKRLSRFTRHSITSLDKLIEQLEEVRRTGVAFVRDEYTDGISAVAAVIEDQSGSTAAVSVPMPSQRFAGNERRLSKMLLERVNEINRSLSNQAAA